MAFGARKKRAAPFTVGKGCHDMEHSSTRHGTVISSARSARTHLVPSAWNAAAHAEAALDGWSPADSRQRRLRVVGPTTLAVAYSTNTFDAEDNLHIF